jgi:hypothetical protein
MTAETVGNGSQTKQEREKEIKNILIRRRESNTYLAIVSRHHCSSWITMKKDEILWLSARTVAFIS